MQSVHRKTIALFAGFTMMLGGCSLPKGEFPSLAKRPYETNDPVAEPQSAPEILSTSLPDSLRAQINALVAKHDAADNAFSAALPAARQAAQSAAGRAPGSESWVEAQMAVSRLEKQRSDSLSAMAELDRLVAVERDKGADAGLIAMLTPYQDKIRREVEAQTAILMELTRIIG